MSYIQTMRPLSEITTYQAGAAQAAANRALQKACDDILMPYGITKMHWLIIGTILDHGKEGARVSDLAKELSTTMGYLTNNLKVLESKGIVRRIDDDTDNRSRPVLLTPKFAKLCPKIERQLRDGLRTSIYGAINPEEFRIYLKVLFTLSQAKL